MFESYFTFWKRNGIIEQLTLQGSQNQILQPGSFDKTTPKSSNTPRINSFLQTGIP